MIIARFTKFMSLFLRMWLDRDFLGLIERCFLGQCNECQTDACSVIKFHESL